MQHPLSGPFQGTERFELVRSLGAGGMGAVYEAFDHERKTTVALKTLHAMNAEALLRFKNEFREFQNLQHPNLITLGELYAEGSDWFFTMELVDGKHFLDWVRTDRVRPRPFEASEPSAVSAVSPSVVTEDIPQSERTIHRNIILGYDEAKLRDALLQVAEGLCALHDAQKVHRDIKPSNVLVARDGRVKILDFGLATDVSSREHRSEVDIVGTVEYMAPEQAAGRQVGAPADWYAMGVMLFEALTGDVPFTGTAIEVLMNKQRLEAPSVRSKNANAPADLDALCADMLRFNPALRPTGIQVLARLGGQRSSRPSTHSLSSFSTSADFIGRSHELAILNDRYEVSRTEAQTALVYGESGLGKSALARHFTEQLKLQDPDVVVLAGTCYERESVPFKAVDGVVDALSQYMRRIPKVEAAALLPRKAALLAQVFPVLQRVEAVAEAPRPPNEVLDPQELRNHLFFAVRELFQRLADRHPLVLVIDDLQWADADSLALLGEIMRPPEAPPLLLVATVRSDEGDSAVHRRESLAKQLRGPVTELYLQRMSIEESRELAKTLVRRAHDRLKLDPDAIAREAAGHPLFIDELIRHANAVGSQTPGALQLEEALWARISQLDAGPRHVLELLALAAGRLVQQTAAQAAAMPFGDFAKHIGLLRVAHLVRTTGMRNTDTVEPYHDRVRRAVLAHLMPNSLRGLHRRLALAHETTGQADAEALAVHWRDAGEHGKASQYAEVAAQKAAKALAFDRAARFYEQCISLSGGRTSRDVRVRLAEALANAGRGGDAGNQFLLAAEGANAGEALDLQRRAAEQLLRSGHIDEGLRAIDSVCKPVGLKMTTTPKGALASLLYRRAVVRARGLGFRERDESELPVSELQKIDICWSVSAGLGLVDTIRGADFQSRQLILALRAGEPYRVVRALAMETAYAAVGGESTRKRTDKLLETAEALASRLDRPHALGLTRWAAGTAAFLQGRWRDGFALNSEAEEILRDRCTGVTWELDTARFMALWSAFYRGDVRELQRRVPALRLESESRGDLYAVTNLRTTMTPFLALIDDDPKRSRSEADDAIARWSRQGFHIQHCNALFAQVQAALYEGAAAEARERIERDWDNLESAMVLRVQQIRVRAVHFRACARATSGDASAARDDVRRLEREGVRWAAALALLVRAAIEENDRAIATLRAAVMELEACDLGLYAGAAKRRLAIAETGDETAPAVRQADSELQARGVRNPARLTAMLSPGPG
jgi:serine/threonine protein kinase